jgi:hypothetical protein
MNAAYGAPEDLPFDLKMHRVMTYDMPEGVTDRTAEPTSSARSDHYYLFACPPHDDSLSRPLDGAVGAQSRDSVVQAFGSPEPDRLPWKRRTTTFERNQSAIERQRLSLTPNGALGFVTLSCAHTDDGLLLFFPTEFLYDLACFLACASTFYGIAGYRGGGMLRVRIQVPQARDYSRNRFPWDTSTWYAPLRSAPRCH